MYIIIAGKGELCYYLAVDLSKKGHEVTVVSTDSDLCERVKGIPNCTAIEGYGLEPSVLERAGLRRADALVACEEKDEENLVICHLTEVLQSPVRTIALVRNPKNDPLFRKLGIDSIVNTTTTVTQVIEYELPGADLMPIVTINRGKMKIVEIEIRENSTCVGKAIQEINLPKGALITTLVRDDTVIIPYGGTTLQAGDMLIALTEPDGIEPLRKALFGL